MKTSALALMVAVLNPVADASAQDMIKGVYAKSAEQCMAAKKDLQAFLETGESVLTPDGIWGIEYNCEFLDWKKSTRSPGAIVTALCEEPDHMYPQVYAAISRIEGELELTAPPGLSQEEMPGNAGVYYLCEGVSPP